MRKTCLICTQEFKTGDIVISPMVGKITILEDKYELAVFQQTVLSHLYCAENKPVIAAEATEVNP